jgi:hypothetical protein
MQRFDQAPQILRMHANNSATRTINVGYKKERYGKCDWQNQEKQGASPVCTLTNQKVAENGDRRKLDALQD